jgi:hypothetical protein
VVKERVRQQIVAQQHKPWELVSIFRRDNLRVINQVPVSNAGKLKTQGRIQHADPIGEMIHVSAFERLSKQIHRERKNVRYWPANLTAAIPFVAASYVKTGKAGETPWPFLQPVFSWQRIYVVDWDGIPLSRENPDHVRRVFDVIPRPEAMNISAMPSEMLKYVFQRPSKQSGP